MVIKPKPDRQDSEKSENGTGCSNSDSIGFENGAHHVTLIRANYDQNQEILAILDGILHLKSYHKQAEHVPEEMHEPIMEKGCSQEAPYLELFDNIISIFSLEGSQSTNPLALVITVVTHDCGIHDLSENEHANADYDDQEIDRIDLEMREDSLKTLKTTIFVCLARNIESI